MSTYGYVRSSQPPKAYRDRQPDEIPESPLGIESQRREILAKFPDAVIVEDRFRSGRNARRPGLRSLLERLGPGDMGVVVRLDRLARDSALAVHLEYEIERVRESRLVSLAGEGTSIDGSPPDPTQVFLRRVIAAQAELQAAQASTSTRAALAVKRAAGVSTNGTAVYGWGVEPGGRIIVHPGEQEVLAAIRERTRGRLWNASPQDVADWLNGKGYRNRAGKPFSRTGVLRIVRAMQAREKTLEGATA